MADSNQFATTIASSIDFAALLKRCMGRVDLMARVLATFRQAVTREIKDLTAALVAQDRSAILSISHRLKGACLTASAETLARIADRVHMDTACGATWGSIDVCNQLSTELTNLLEQISAWEEEVRCELK